MPAALQRRPPARQTSGPSVNDLQKHAWLHGQSDRQTDGISSALQSQIIISQPRQFSPAPTLSSLHYISRLDSGGLFRTWIALQVAPLLLNTSHSRHFTSLTHKSFYMFSTRQQCSELSSTICFLLYWKPAHAQLSRWLRFIVKQPTQIKMLKSATLFVNASWREERLLPSFPVVTLYVTVPPAFSDCNNLVAVFFTSGLSKNTGN
ncbi:hypothetical protein J6590_006166 [Homalodisca vitripennis]|nr:hypothetical protein J6590_006166 [Homalodisca vitripennis]